MILISFHITYYRVFVVTENKHMVIGKNYTRLKKKRHVIFFFYLDKFLVNFISKKKPNI